MQQLLSILGLSLVVAGLALALVSILLLLKSGRFKGSGGAIILIGPIPIILSSDRRITLIMLALAAILVLIFLIGLYGAGP